LTASVCFFKERIVVKEIIGDYELFIEKADALIAEQNIDASELVQCDTVCYRVETVERYEEIKRQLADVALMLNETEVNGRLIAVFAPYHPLRAGRWQSISYVEIPQPKPGSHYPEGIDHVQMVTRRSLSDFQKAHTDIAFEEKGLANKLNPLLKLSNEEAAVKFHDKHMGSVIELESKLDY
jgi:predicted metalloenzyme YecM